MSAAHGLTAPDMIRSNNSPLFRHIRLTLALASRAIDDVAESLVVHFTYGAQDTPVAYCALSFRDGTTRSLFWHTGWHVPISLAEARLLLDPTRLTEPERRLLQDTPPPPRAQDAAHDAQQLEQAIHTIAGVLGCPVSSPDYVSLAAACRAFAARSTQPAAHTLERLARALRDERLASTSFTLDFYHECCAALSKQREDIR